jgi:phosphate starvation-inducible PhoH-like protein
MAYSKHRNGSHSQEERPSEMISIFPKTPGQQRLVESIAQNSITICTAPAGSGKTLLTLYEAVMMQKKQSIREILYTKPIVDFPSLQGIGFLPGEADEKLAPLLWPVKDNLKVFCGDAMQEYLLRKKKIEPILLQDLRGRSLNDTFLIADEMQNATPQVVEMILTRIGDRAKIVIMGDYHQKDSKDKFYDGLSDAVFRLKDLPEVGIVEMGWEDVVRSGGLVGEIQQRYHSN